MKRILPLLMFLLISDFVFSQEQKLYTAKVVKEMPVFPGCENIKPIRKKEMNECMAAQISDLLGKKLYNIDEVMSAHGVSSAAAVIQFIISKEGVLLGINELEGGDPVLGEASVIALNRISMELPPIRPAKLDNGEMVNLVYQLPVTYQGEDESVADAPEYPVDEIVLFTLFDGEKAYEIRLFENRSIKVYEFHAGEETYLGKFLSIGEVERSEPYKSMIEKEVKANGTFVTAGSIGTDEYEIYIHNLFKQDRKRNPVFVEVFKVKDGLKKSVQVYHSEENFKRSKYAPMIYRE